MEKEQKLGPYMTLDLVYKGIANVKEDADINDIEFLNVIKMFSQYLSMCEHESLLFDSKAGIVNTCVTLEIKNKPVNIKLIQTLADLWKIKYNELSKRYQSSNVVSIEDIKKGKKAI